jgi:hypothetical protein
MRDELVLRLAQPPAALLPAFLELAAEFVAEYGRQPSGP